MIMFSEHHEDRIGKEFLHIPSSSSIPRSKTAPSLSYDNAMILLPPTPLSRRGSNEEERLRGRLERLDMLSVRKSHDTVLLAPLSKSLGKPKTSKSCQGVRFADPLTKESTIKRQMDMSEHATLWYSSEELQEQREFDTRMLRAILNGTHQFNVPAEILVQVIEKLVSQRQRGGSHESWDIRGLEHYIDGGRAREERKRNMKRAVLSSRTNNSCTTIDTPLSGDSTSIMRRHCKGGLQFSSMYTALSKKSAEIALARAARDRAFTDNELFRTVLSAQEEQEKEASQHGLRLEK